MSVTHANLLSLLHRANQIAAERFIATLGDAHVTPRQVQVLAAIEDNAGASQTRIVELTHIDRSTLADIIRRLHKGRLIERRRSKADKRAYVLKLSAAGRQALASGQPALDQIEAELLERLPAGSRLELVEMLERLVEHPAPDAH